MQNEIGADVIMALDDVISSQTTGERVEEVGEGGRGEGGGGEGGGGSCTHGLRVLRVIMRIR